jgi:2-oxoglutarate dehydrogenase E2 component (dihydrolipoamide succinyltransferase)
MKLEIKVPAMGESISEATIGQIIKPSGSSVAMDDEILELETDKVNQVMYAPQSGVLNLNVQPHDVVKIGQVIGTVDTEGVPQAADQRKEEPKTAEKPVQKQPEEKTQKEESKGTKPAEVKAPTTEPSLEKRESIRQTKEDYISQLSAKKTSQEKSVSPASIPSKRTEPGQRETRSKLTKIRKVIASRLVEVQRTTAMLTTFNEVDMSRVIELREKYKETFAKEYQAKLGFMSFFVKASVAALEAFPNINSYIDGEDLVHREYYDIGIAVGTDRGLFVPVVRDCDKLSFAEIEIEIEKYAAKARNGTVTLEDLQGGGFTITNGGVYGSLLSTPILNPPQSGILGMHKIMKRAVVVDDQIVIRPMMYLALSYDHRIVDGKEAVSFLVHIKNSLEDPGRLLIGV